MITHWTDHSKIKQLILDEKPQHILELGALNGENTANLLSIMPECGFKLTVISDDLDANPSVPGVELIQGVSYEKIPQLQDDSIDLCLLDTDHNYWTLIKELMVLDAKLRVGGLIAIHDVETFYYDTGLADFYADGSDYPAEIIKSQATRGSLGTAVIDFLSRYKFNYRLVRWVPEKDGMAILRKNPTEIDLSLMSPGSLGSGKRKGAVNV